MEQVARQPLSPDPQTVYPSFGDMMREIVLPMHLAHPSHKRLDSPRTDVWFIERRLREGYTT